MRFVALALAMVSLVAVTAPSSPAMEPELAHRGCCSRHGGVCGCAGGRTKCCDGALSPSCQCVTDDGASC